MSHSDNRPAGIGPGFQFDTRHSPDKPPAPCPWARPTPPFKQYDDPLAVVQLPEPRRTGGEPLWELIARRRTQRRFSAEPISLQELSQLLWAIQGVTGETNGFILRTVASAGALYPNDTYLVLNNVEGAGPGIAHYQVREHSLAILKEGPFGQACVEACFGQRFCGSAAVVFAWGAVVSRCAQKYGDRAYRYIHLDAGHIGGQLQLAAAGLGLGSVNIGAYMDEKVDALFGLDGVEETVVYLTAVGRPRPRG